MAVSPNCPDRPASERPTDLGFRRRRMVQWFGPNALLATRVVPAIRSLAGAYGGRRELQAAVTSPSLHDLSDHEELWFDFVADTGDGWHSTQTMAWLLARDLVLDGVPEPARRGSILVMGGDQVYPTASATAYADRFEGPFTAALPCLDDGERPRLFAIPGNHDWYDQLTAFTDVFCRRRRLGGWQTEQTRSSFALRLPHAWWLWGIDIALDELIDEPQLAFFRDVATRSVRPGDRIILVVAKPSWVHGGLRGDEAYKANRSPARNLQYFEREVIEPSGAQAVLMLSGDLHHYARYERDDGGRHKITAGGGGAYLYPTHHLRSEVGWPERGETAIYRRAAVHPDARTSRRLSAGCLLLAIRNPGFAAIGGTLLVLLGWLAQFALRAPGRGVADTMKPAPWLDVLEALFRNPASAVLALVILVGWIGFADAPGMTGKVLMGLAHGGAQLTAAVLLIRTAARLGPNGPWFVPAFLAFLLVVGGLAVATVVGIYLFAVHRAFGAHPNEVFAAQHLADHKDFLRLRIAEDGSLSVFPVAVDRICRSWRLRTGGSPGDPWFEPSSGDIPVRLIEPPITVPGR